MMRIFPNGKWKINDNLLMAGICIGSILQMPLRHSLGGACTRWLLLKARILACTASFCLRIMRPASR